MAKLNIKKGDKRSFRVKLTETPNFMDASHMMQSHIDSLLIFHLQGNHIARIASRSKIRYDIKGELIGLNS